MTPPFFIYESYRGMLFSLKSKATLLEARIYADQRQEHAKLWDLNSFFVVKEGTETLYSTEPKPVETESPPLL